jgi:hypothetical protein
MTCFTEIEKTILKFIWKHTRSPISKTILSKRSEEVVKDIQWPVSTTALYPLEWLKLKRMTISSTDMDVEKLKLSCIISSNVK